MYADVVAAPLFKKMSFSSNSLWSFHTFDLDHKYKLLVQTEETAMSCKNSQKKNHQALASDEVTPKSRATAEPS